DRVRVTAQLIDGKSGGHVWAERYDRDLTDIFTIQDEISKAIVSALKVRLLPEEKKAIEQRGTTSAEAYNLYLLARQYWVTGNHGDPRREERVMRICQRAVEIDPYYAQAWALLAIAQSGLHYGFGQKVAELMDGDFHAWAMLSTCYRAIGELEKLRGAATKMVSEGERAVQQDPSNGAALGILAGGYALLGDEERTREWIARALLIDPDNLNMRYNFACVLAGHLGDTEGALHMLQSTLPRAGAYQVRVAETDTDLDALRDDPRFRKLLDQAKQRLGIKDAAAEPARMPAAASPAS